MMMFKFFSHILNVTSRLMAWVGMAFLLGAMLVTALDVILRHINNEGVLGAVDVVQLMIMSAAFLSIPYGFISNSHVSVSLIADHFSRRGDAMAKLLAAVLATCFMSAIAWFGLEQAIMQMEYGDVSLTLGIPKIYYWIPLLLGSFLSGLVCLHLAIEAVFVLVTGKSAFTPPAPVGDEK